MSVKPFVNVALDFSGVKRAVRLSFSCFTVLCFRGQAFCITFAAAHAASFALTGRLMLVTWPGVLKRLHSLPYATTTVFPSIVTGECDLCPCLCDAVSTDGTSDTAAYWTLLSQTAFGSARESCECVSKHIINPVFAALWMVLPTSHPHPWIHVFPLVGIVGAIWSLHSSPWPPKAFMCTDP